MSRVAAAAPRPSCTISIVSHGHGAQLQALLQDCERFALPGRIVVTSNVPEAQLQIPPRLRDQVVHIENTQPLGFAANHNQAFAQCDTPLFCVLNPDVRLTEDPFPLLEQTLSDPAVGLAAPCVATPNGSIEDSVRRFPTIRGLVIKSLGGADGRYRLDRASTPVQVDWVGGMFMLFRAEAFAAVRGFDERFFLYYEDVDICARLWKAGYQVLACPQMSVIHDARRASRHDWQHRRWHAASMLRYFAKHWGRLP